MLNIYLFIELLGGTDAGATLDRIRALDLTPCRIAHAVELNPQKLVAQVDCPSLDDANAAVLQKLVRVDGVVQTNVIATVHPRH